MLTIKFFSETEPFDKLVIPKYKSEECFPVVMDVDLEYGTVEICVDESPECILERCYAGLFVRLPIYCVPTPEGANALLMDKDIIKQIDRLVQNTDISTTFQGTKVGATTAPMNDDEGMWWDEIVKLIVKKSEEIEKVEIWEASEYFDDDATTAFFEQYKMWHPKTSYSVVAEEITKEYNGQIGDVGPIFLLNIENYVEHMYNSYVSKMQDLVESYDLEFGEFNENYSFLEVETHQRDAHWVHYGGWNNEGDAVVGGNTLEELQEQLEQLKEG